MEWNPVFPADYSGFDSILLPGRREKIVAVLMPDTPDGMCFFVTGGPVRQARTKA